MTPKQVRFDVTYIPEKKDGEDNLQGLEFTYKAVTVTGEYSSAGYPAGFQAVVDGSPRRFAYAGIKNMTIAH